MRALTSIQKQMKACLVFMHASRWKALWASVEAVITGKQLWLSGIGRAWPTKAQAKHRIKAIDRLLGNSHLHKELMSIYRVIADAIWQRKCHHPLVLVDVTDLRPYVCVMTASLAFDGRSIPIYQKVKSKKEISKVKTRRAFLRDLKKVLPPRQKITLVLVTDAGFQSPWFDEVEAMGWDYLGRVRHQTKFYLDGEWVTAQEIHKRAKTRAQNLGEVVFPIRNPKPRRLVLAKRRTGKNRKRLTFKKTPRKDCKDPVYRKKAKEPWLLATSLKCNPQTVVELYALRMEIEQNFRDAKNHRWGFSVIHARCRSNKRWEVLLLIGAIAILVQLSAGVAAEQLNLHHRHQANTIRTRRVLSLFFLGGLVLNSCDRKLLRSSELIAAFNSIVSKTQEIASKCD